MNQTQAIPYRQSFLRQQAQEAWNYFKKTGYPSSRDENWRFSNPNPWLLQSLVPLTDKEDIKREEFGAYIIPGTIPILILNDSISIYINFMYFHLLLPIKSGNHRSFFSGDRSRITIFGNGRSRHRLPGRCFRYILEPGCNFPN